MKVIHMRFTAVLSFCLGALVAAASPAPPASPEVRYEVTLKPGGGAPDVTALGGRIEARNASSLMVVIPAAAAGALADSPDVASLALVVDPASLPVRKVVPQSAVTLWGSGQYEYDGAGNITAIGTAAAPNSDGKVSTFTYDEASRLTDATIRRAGEDIEEHYDYDGFGNLKKHTRTKPVAQAAVYPPAAYPPSLVTNRLTEPGTSYDEAGNVTDLAGAHLTYDGFNQVTSKTQNGNTYTYIYDVNEERLGIQYGPASATPATTHWTIRDFDNKPILQFDSTVALTASNWAQTEWPWVESFVWSDGRMLAAERPNNVRLHYHIDHLGSTRLLTDAGGQLVAGSITDYAPYGEEMTTPGGELLKFTGHERDYDLSQPSNDNYLDYMHARYYDSRRGRFLAFDPNLDIDEALESPQNWNRYSYAANSPLNATDPDGREQRFNARHYDWKRYNSDLNKAGHYLKKALDWAAPRIMVGAAFFEGLELLEMAGPGPAIQAVERGLDEATQAEEAAADDALVVRGGQNTPESFTGAPGASVDEKGNLQNVSVNSAPGKTTQELSKTIPHGQVGVTTVGKVKAAGGKVVPSASDKNPDHCTLCDISPKAASKLFTPTVPNPNKPKPKTK